MDVDVVVAGGGPAGLLLASELRLGGADPVVLEQLAAPTGLSKALGLVRRVVQTLDQRGLLERFGPGQTADKPFGDGPVDQLHAWMFDTPDENKAEVDRVVSAGAFVMGRNMFGPIRDDWDLGWRGWWGEDPPYHAPVFVLTHHPRDPLTMQGGTTFTFVTDGVHSALDQARTAAGDRDVAIAGGAATVNQYLAAGLIDELRTHIAPVTLGAGEGLFDGVPPLQLEILAVRAASLATHISYRLPH